MSAPLFDLVLLTLLTLVACVATGAAVTRDPVRQAPVLALLGLLLAGLFAVFQAPDAALSQLAVGTAVTPLLILLTARRTRARGKRDKP